MAKNVEDLAIILSFIAGKDPLDSTTVDEKVNKPKVKTTDLKKITLGVPKEYFSEGLDKEVEKTIRDAIEQFKSMGAKIKDISMPHTPYVIPTYYLIAMAEVSSNLSRYDGIKYGQSELNNSECRIQNLIEGYFKTRGKYLGDECKRKIILGTYELSAGYYDAYYKKAQKARTLIKKDFDEAFKKVDAILTPVSPFPPFGIGEKTGNPLSMYLSDIYTVQLNLAGVPGISIPAGFTANRLPIGLQIIGPRFGEEDILGIAAKFEKKMKLSTKFPKL